MTEQRNEIDDQFREGADYPTSVYATDANRADYDISSNAELHGEQGCDVCVVGGGFAGVSAALHLAQNGFETVLLEANKLGFGASGRNGGQIHYGLRKDQDELAASYGPDSARVLWDLVLEAIKDVRDLAASSRHDIEFQSGLIHAVRKKSELDSYHSYLEHLWHRYNFTDYQLLDRQQLANAIGSQHYVGGYRSGVGGHVHPLKLLFTLAETASKSGVRIYENTRVTDIGRNAPLRFSTRNGAVVARFGVLAVNGNGAAIDRYLRHRVLPLKNYIVATEPLGEMAEQLIPNREAVSDSANVVRYWRLDKRGRLLFGGGETSGKQFVDNIPKLVLPHLLDVYPQLRQANLSPPRIDYAWGGTLGITSSRLPVFCSPSPDIIAIGGFSGEGVALAPFAGKLVAECLVGHASRFDQFSQFRNIAVPVGDWGRSALMTLATVAYKIRDRL